jgi:small subunit ribosomal protein S27Ae
MIMSIHKYYKITDDGKLIRLNSFCPRCGPGFFMAQNYDRFTCGACGYTEFKKRGPKKEEDFEADEEKGAEASLTPTTEVKPSPKGKKKKGKK